MFGVTIIILLKEIYNIQSHNLSSVKVKGKGNKEREVYFKIMGVKKLDHVIGTHPHEEHLHIDNSYLV
ncbi:MAG: hypothetical protein PWP71_2623 [Clostridia bacterium]|nr:hypothetical protein [Clostridia bacterium]